MSEDIHNPQLPVGKHNSDDEIVKDANVFDGSEPSNVLNIQYSTFKGDVVEMADSLPKRLGQL
ncbi:hypothetical protein I314_05336 [Cryptococcus bacillisporus CA1873]|uniref:Uncharacterized protein n=2 Tax=Cryptococcus gattii TaxID=552467 RepID=A0A0D0VM61_CRYGA|nr:hypothetical protein I312_04592 [Cryptococcus bacillisporus CA1280]KIR58922.1 hypothetical protein I314_05336 [Cryptococcus bacillisporus CA1873]|eukprot:KIR58922.1 hypothetical protein I314_05336 [Cryptococcus gattii CA1873]